MKLVFDETPFLEVRDVNPTANLTPPTELELYASPLIPLGTSLRPWRTSALLWGLSPDHHVEVISEKAASSSVDWPLRVLESVIQHGDKVTEARITVYYILLEWGATVVLRGTTAQIASTRERALKLMFSGRPDWTSDNEVVALAQLYADPAAGASW